MMKMKMEYCVLRSGKIKFCCPNKDDAIDTASYYNGIKAPDTDEYIPAYREVTEWKTIDDTVG